MLKIINNLKPFFEDCYRRINIREYAKIMKISPPTSSKLLFDYYKKGLLKKQEYRNYIFYYANQESKQFIDLSRIYWSYKLEKLTDFIDKELINPAVVLFGSTAKAEVKENSDIDIAVFSSGEINLKDVKNFESELNRKIQIFEFNSLKNIKNKELMNNIINGYILRGKLT